MSWILALILAASVIGGGGLAYAADGAAPGDALYGLDRAMETVRANLTTDPVESIELELAFAQERALEVGQTAGDGEPAHLGQALDNYGDTISAVARGVAAVEGPAGATPEAQLTQALAIHDRVLQRAFDGEDGDQDRDQVREQDQEQYREDWCNPVIDGHPAADMIALRYGVGYGVVMGWFCEGAGEGVGFGEIMLALRICEGAVGCVDVLFGDRQLLGWGEIMRDHDVIGRPEHAGPEGEVPPGPPDEGDDPPHGVGRGQPEGVPNGPPVEGPLGPPEGVPDGPPVEGPLGPPEGVPPAPNDAEGPPGEVAPGPGGDSDTGDGAPPGPQGNGGAESGTPATGTGGG